MISFVNLRNVFLKLVCVCFKLKRNNTDSCEVIKIKNKQIITRVIKAGPRSEFVLVIKISRNILEMFNNKKILGQVSCIVILLALQHVDVEF